MTAGQITAPYRQIRTSLLVAALAVTFGMGLLAGLAVPRTAGQVAHAAANAGVVASSTGSGTSVDTGAANLRGKRDFQAAANAGVVASSTGSGTSVDTGAANLRGKRDFQAAANAGVVASSTGSGTSVDTGAANLRGKRDFQAAANRAGVTAATGSGSDADALTLVRVKHELGR